MQQRPIGSDRRKNGFYGRRSWNRNAPAFRGLVYGMAPIEAASRVTLLSRILTPDRKVIEIREETGAEKSNNRAPLYVKLNSVLIGRSPSHKEMKPDLEM